MTLDFGHLDQPSHLIVSKGKPSGVCSYAESHSRCLSPRIAFWSVLGPMWFAGEMGIRFHGRRVRSGLCRSPSVWRGIEARCAAGIPEDASWSLTEPASSVRTLPWMGAASGNRRGVAEHDRVSRPTPGARSSSTAAGCSSSIGMSSSDPGSGSISSSRRRGQIGVSPCS